MPDAMQVEISQLERRYARLRIRDTAQDAKLLASLARDGQQSPVTVVAATEPERFVLIDGYARVAALTKLARDLVEVVVLSLSEAEALVRAHRLEGERRRSALEDGWLLQELIDRHGLSLAQLATRLGRSRSSSTLMRAPSRTKSLGPCNRGNAWPVVDCELPFLSD